MQLVEIDVSELIGDFFDAGDFQALPFLHRLDIACGLLQRFVGAGVEPAEAPAQRLDLQGAAPQIFVVDIGDFQFAPGGGPDLPRRWR